MESTAPLPVSVPTSTVSSKNQIVVPKKVRQVLGISGGDKIVYISMGDGRYLIKKQPTVHELFGSVQPGAGDAVERVGKLRDEWDESRGL